MDHPRHALAIFAVGTTGGGSYIGAVYRSGRIGCHEVARKKPLH